MTPRFLKMWPFLVEWEGSRYENDPDDPGGATRWGIDQRSHPRENIRNLTEARAKEIYFREYWTANGCEILAPGFGEVWFNCCVNAGRGRAEKILATGAHDALAFLAEQDRFYRRLARARPKSAKYLKGWLNRTEALRRFLKLK